MIGGNTWEKPGRKASFRQVDPAVSLAVRCGGAPGHRGGVASVEEHDTFATADPSSIFVREPGGGQRWEPLSEYDFPAIWELFLQKEQFYVFSHRDAGFGGLRANVPAEPHIDAGRYRDMIERVRLKYGELLPFFQKLLLQDLVLRLLSEMPGDAALYLELVKQLDDNIICEGVPEDVRVRLLSFKYSMDIRDRLLYREGRLKFENLTVASLKGNPFVIDRFEYKEGVVRIGGTAVLPFGHRGIHYFFMDHKNKKHELEWEEGEEWFFLGERMQTRKRFTAALKTRTRPAGLRFMYGYKKRYRGRIRMKFAGCLQTGTNKRENIVLSDGFVMRAEKNELSVQPFGKRMLAKLFFTFPIKSIRMYLCFKRDV